MARAQETVTDMPQIGDRLAAARRSRFVGRQAELEQFGAALLAAEPPFAVLYLHGPGGVGKSTLLHAFARLAAASSRPVLFLDGHHLAPTPPDFLRVLGHQLGQAGGALTDIVRAWPSQGVLLLDTYEQLAPLDGWLRDTLLPQLPTDTLIVLASRTPPASAWRTDLAWADLLHPVLLDNLPPFESRAYLQARGIPLSLHADVLAFTHGHPLALALVADVLRQGSMPATFRPEAAPDVMRALLERFLHDAPSQEHRQALDICVLAWATTESLLAAVLDTPDTAALFAWLRGLSFIAQGPYGLFPHDLMREALLADLRWRDPVGHRHLVGRLVAYLAQELTQARGVVQQRLCFDLLALTRHHPAYQTYFDWKAFGSGYAAPAVPDDHTALVALIAQHEGAASAQIAQYWLGCQPHAWLAFHSLDGALLGGMAHLALEQLQPDDAAADPAVAAAWAFVERHGPLRAGETILYLRFWLGQTSYQDVSPALNLAAVHGALGWIGQQGLAWSLLATAEPNAHAAHFASINFCRVADADFVVGGRQYGVFAHDWRVETVAEWLNSKVDLASNAPAPHQPPVALAPARVVLTHAAFADAVRQALRDYAHPERLVTNSLLQTRLVAPAQTTQAAVALVQALLREALVSLETHPKDAKFHRALWQTYFAPALSQEQVAERLGLPFNTYRYHLAQGIARIVEWLWQRERAGS